MILRSYIASDAEKLYSLFYDTVHTVNAGDYEKEQLDVWASGEYDIKKWNDSFLTSFTIVAIDNDRNDKIIGFGNIHDDGYLDMLFVHKDYQRMGTASAICDRLENHVNGIITTCASITAKPFFEQRGYIVVKEQTVVRNGIKLINYLMEK